MCQMNVVLEHDGEQEKIMDNVTHLEVTGEGVLVSTLF
jgi:predicted RNA-binding protein